jgi:hypothetical protein
MSFGRIFLLICVALVIAALVFTGVWHLFTLFAWEFPTLSWLPLLVLIVVGYIAGTVRVLASSGRATPAPAATPMPPANPAPAAETTVEAGTETETTPAPAAPAVATADPSIRPQFWFLPGFLAGLAVVLLGIWFTVISPRHIPLDDIDYTFVNELPQHTQPRLLPRSGVKDDPAFRDSGEIHLVRNPVTGGLLWTGEWEGSWTGGESQGVSVKPLDDVISKSHILRAGFDHSVAGITPSTFKGKAKLDHPFSRIQYPVLVPNGKDEAFAMAPYVGYSGFPFTHPYLKGVMVYHQDGTIEDLTPDEAAARPELVRTGRIVPETVARSEADAIASDLGGEINDAEDNKQPYLTSIDADKTVWLTVIDSKSNRGGVIAVVLTNSSTNQTEVWKAPPDHPLVTTQEVINDARSLPLQWEEERCCDSDGDSYTVTLREVVEPRLAFKDGHPYYLVTVVPTDDLALPREVEYTLLIDAESGKVLEKFDHVSDGIAADAKPQAFFAGG